METVIIPGADKCPQCGCEDQAVDEVLDQLREQKLIPQESFKEGLAIQATLFDPTRQTILTSNFTIPIVQVRFEVCSVCHTMYCTSIAVLGQQAEVQRPPRGPSVPPGLRQN